MLNYMKKCAFCEYDDEEKPCYSALNNDFGGHVMLDFIGKGVNL